MKKLILTFAILLISNFAFSQSLAFYNTNVTILAVKNNGVKASYDSMQIALQADSVRLSVVTPYSYIAFDGSRINNGDYLIFDPRIADWQPISSFRFAQWYTSNKNILYDAGVRTQTENDARYATTAQGGKADSALQPGTAASNISQDATHRYVTDSDKTNWNGKLSFEVDGSITNEIQTLSLSGQNLTISGTGGNTVTLPSPSISVSTPSIGNTYTSGTAFQSSTSLNTTYTFVTTVTGAAGLVGNIKIETSTSQFGTYSEYTSEGLGIVILGSQKASTSVTVGKNTWIKVTLTKDALATISGVYTKVEF